MAYGLINNKQDQDKFNECLLDAKGDERNKTEKSIQDAATDSYLRYKALTDLFFLGYHILGWKIPRINKTYKRKSKGKTRIDPVFHRWLAKVIEEDDDLLLLVPRDHLKSTWVKLDIIQNILKNPYVRIGLFSVSSGLGRDQLQDIKNTLEAPMLRRLFPDIVPPRKKWLKTDRDTLTMIRPDKKLVLQGPQITVRGTGGKVTGHHVDIGYFDDIIDFTTVTTAEQMKKSEDWWSYLQSVVEVTGIRKVIGTHYHYNDVYNLMIRNKHIAKNRIFKRSAIENGKVLYKSWYTLEALDDLKRILSNYIFSCQYMLNPIPEEDQIFPAPQPTFNPPLPRDAFGYKFYITLDPAATTETYSDETGLVVSAVNSINQVFAIEAIGMKLKGDKVADLLIKKCVQYNPVKIGIELGLQTHLQYIIDQRKHAYEVKHRIEVPMNIVPIHISNKMSKRAKINLTLGSFCRQRNYFVSEHCRDLLKEMDHFTGKGNEKDNLVDAASMVFQLMDGFAYKYWNTQYSSKSGTYEELFKSMIEQKGYEWRKEFVA